MIGLAFNSRFKKVAAQCLLRAGLAVGTMSASIAALALPMDQTTIDLSILSSSGAGVRLSPGESYSIRLGHRMFVHKLMLQVESVSGNSGAEIIVNGDRKANVWLQSVDPMWVTTIEAETSSIEIVGIQSQMGPQGRFVVKAAKAVVSDTDWSPSVEFPSHPEYCNGCSRLGFPIYYTTVMGNVANRAIVMVDRLADYANYRDYGNFLLPVKKAAAEARSVAEARGDASQYARAYYFNLLKALDHCESYFSDTFERGAVFESATELLALREHIRDILD